MVGAQYCLTLRSRVPMSSKSDFGSTDIARISLDHQYEYPPPPPPDIATAGIVAVDITDKFSEAVKSKFCVADLFVHDPAVD